MASVRASTCTDAIGNLTLCRISNSTRIEQRIQFDRHVISHSTQSYPVTLSELSSVPSVTDLIMSESAQSRMMVTQSAVNSLQLPVFSMVNVTTQSEQRMPTGQSYSLITAPSVSWTGQRPPLSYSASQVVTSGHTCGRDLTMTE